jgi:NADPH:quinone reductase
MPVAAAAFGHTCLGVGAIEPPFEPVFRRVVRIVCKAGVGSQRAVRPTEKKRLGMRAAVIPERGGAPIVRDIDEPGDVDGAVLIDVATAGLGGWDILGQYREGVEYPMVVRGEGVGRASDGRRVYFGERSLLPYGAWAERTVVPAEEVWDVPDDVDDGLAIAMAIAGTGALIPLEHAQIQPGETVLILGATGTLGQIALQLARRMGAGRVIGAGRDATALARAVAQGIADGVVQMGIGDDDERLRDETDGGFDVVLDVVHGEPFLSALKATRFGGRVITIGVGAGLTACVSAADLLFRTHTVVGTGQRPPADREAIWNRLLALAREESFVIDYAHFTLDQAGEAWAAQAASPHAKVLGTISAP